MRGNDEETVRDCLSGDRHAFEDLLDRYEKTVFNLALRMTGDRDDARDVTQNVFTRAFQNLSKFDFRHRFYSWLYRIAINESIRLLESRRQTRPVDDSMPAEEPSPEDRAGEREVVRAVRRALVDLKPDHKSVIVLKHYLRLSYREMALVLEIPEKTVKSRLFTARRLLREALSGVVRP